MALCSHPLHSPLPSTSPSHHPVREPLQPSQPPHIISTHNTQHFFFFLHAYDTFNHIILGTSLEIAAGTMLPSCACDIERSLDILCSALEAVTADTHARYSAHGRLFLCSFLLICLLPLFMYLYFFLSLHLSLSLYLTHTLSCT